jgi:hypothetical protein
LKTAVKKFKTAEDQAAERYKILPMVGLENEPETKILSHCFSSGAL